MSRKSTKAKTKGRLSVRLELPFAHNSTTMTGLGHSTKVSTFRTKIEQEIGILPEMYHMTYLDAAPLEEDKTLQYHDIIDGATVRLCVWKIWFELLQAAYTGDTKTCLLSSMEITGTSTWSKHCAWCALYVAAHKGHYSLVAKLIEATSLAINTQSPSGWTALHAAARMGRWKALCILIDNGADVRMIDREGLTAFDLARKHGNKQCEQSLNFCHWNLQKHSIVQERKDDYDPRKARLNATRQAHQYKDSTLTTWLRGRHCQMYMIQTPNPITVQDVTKFERERGSRTKERKEHDSRITWSLPALKSTSSHLTAVSHLPTDASRSATTTRSTSPEAAEEKGKKLDFKYGWFDPVRAQQLIPPTHDVLTYANPSSCQLRPRSMLNPGGYKTPLARFYYGGESWKDSSSNATRI